MKPGADDDADDEDAAKAEEVSGRGAAEAGGPAGGEKNGVLGDEKLKTGAANDADDDAESAAGITNGLLLLLPRKPLEKSRPLMTQRFTKGNEERAGSDLQSCTHK